ncbi:MAG: hypothetical protein M1829_002794 [Trizodia sp. TS-e1964]|nr:MAG: hypothetical protein M1829_002794 [Trizodia sp. TS-e1964]
MSTPPPSSKRGSIAAPTYFLSLAPVHSISPRPTTRVFAPTTNDSTTTKAAPAPEAHPAQQQQPQQQQDQQQQQTKTARSGSESSTGTAGSSEFLALGHSWRAEGGAEAEFALE